MLLATCYSNYQQISFLLAAGGRCETQHVLEERPEKAAGQWRVPRKQRFQIVGRRVSRSALRRQQQTLRFADEPRQA